MSNCENNNITPIPESISIPESLPTVKQYLNGYEETYQLPAQKPMEETQYTRLIYTLCNISIDNIFDFQFEMKKILHSINSINNPNEALDKIYMYIFALYVLSGKNYDLFADEFNDFAEQILSPYNKINEYLEPEHYREKINFTQILREQYRENNLNNQNNLHNAASINIHQQKYNFVMNQILAYANELSKFKLVDFCTKNIKRSMTVNN